MFLTLPAFSGQAAVSPEQIGGNDLSADATVTVDYNGTYYPATQVATGIYEVEIPASDEVEHITVTAVKTWYPMGLLDYDLEVDWITETVTAPSPLPIAAVIASLLIVSIGTMVISKKKKK